ncbi:unnamed protein product [Macrosiphum euphorbiae]|uniref:Uncharacterized protein n=1 Tax=Macrosiphum euphorbiae TaxID=13131 RepID=A0AAV0VVL6_9HEMI|nr:unnamed protein product [Macrosiphum euphorbiae]
MQAINFYSVSIFFSCVKLSLGGFEGLSTAGLQSHSVSLSSGSSSNKTNSGSPFLFMKNNRLNFNYPVSKINPYLSLKNINTTPISAINGNKSDHFTSENNIDQLAHTLNDNPGEPGSHSFNLYDATVSVIKAVFKTWKSKQKDMANSFSIPEDIALTVTGSMSILHFIKIQIEHLVRVFYYMFDIEHMMKRDENRETIIANTQSLINRIENDRAQNSTAKYGNSDLETVVNNLKGFLINYRVDGYKYNDIMINIALMKGLMLINETEDNEMSYELNQLRLSVADNFLKEVKKNQYELNGSLVAKNHVKIIRNTMPCLFILLNNHIESYKMLSTHTLDDTEKEKIKIASQLHIAVINTFINRLKIFGTLTQKEISDLKVISKLLEKLDTGKTDQDNTQDPSITVLDNTQDPSETVQENTQDPSETVQGNTQDPSETDPGKTQKRSIPKFIIELMALKEQAIAIVLNLAGGHYVQKWKTNTIFKFKDFQDNQNTEYYMKLLTYNSDTAYLLAGEFEKNFLNEIEYKKFYKGGSEVYFI